MDAFLKQIEEEINGERVRPIAYADDVAFMIKGNSRKELE